MGSGTSLLAQREAALGRPWRPQKRRAKVRKERTGRALVYLRVSTLAQQKDGKNLDGQLDEVRAYCARKGYSFDEERDVFRDIISGARTDRVAYYQLLSRLEKEDAEVVVSWNVSRVGRNSLDGAWLMAKAKEHGFKIETAQEGMDFTVDASSEFVFDILTAVAKYQRNTILQDMERGKKRGHKDGRWVVGTPPIGYSTSGPRGGKVLTPNEDAWIPREVFTRYANGESALKIAESFTARGIKAGGRGGSWGANMVGRILDNPAYVGLLSFRGEIVPGQHDPIVAQDVWDRARALRAARRVRMPGRPRLDEWHSDEPTSSGAPRGRRS